MQSNQTPAIKAKSLPEQWKAIKPEALALSKAIVESPAQLAVLENSITLQDTLTKPTLRSSFKGSDGVAYSVVNVLVNRFLKSFTFSTKLDQTQIELLTVDTLEYFAFETLEDIVLFFKLCRRGRFGTAKKGIDSNLIFGEWFPKYLEQKAEAREQHTQTVKSTHTTNVDPEKIASYYEKKDAKKAAQTKKEKIQIYIDELTKNMDRQMLEDTILDWSKDPVRRPYLDMLKRKRKQIPK